MVFQRKNAYSLKIKLRKQYESNHSKDLAHEAVQIASLTELSLGDRDLSKLDGWKD